MPKHFTDQNFQEEVINASATRPVLVDFFASWCGPCRMQGPIIDELAIEMAEKAVIGKVDVQESPRVAATYKVMSIPMLLIIKDGIIVEQFLGLQSKEQLQVALERHLS